MEEQLFTITVFTEHHVGILHQIAMIFSRRCLNIESIEGRPSSEEGMHRVVITCRSTRAMMEHVVKQLEKRVEVIRATLSLSEQ